jgi:hypothetical protein
VDGDTLSAVLESAPALGELALATDGSFVYTPTLDFTGEVTFSYHADDGSAASNAAVVTLTILPFNADPIVDAGADQSVDEGQAVQFTGSYVDPGRQLSGFSDRWAVTAVTIAWDFGDGDTASGTLTPTHTYADDGFYTVTLTVDDGLGGIGVDELLVTVANVAPALDPINDQVVGVNQPFTDTAAFNDPGLLDTYTLVVDWSDGLTETFNLVAGTYAFDLGHTYTLSGTYTVSVSVSDDDNGSDTLTFIVYVGGAEPPALHIWLPVIQKNNAR